jgi:cystathionine beta-lyase
MKYDFDRLIDRSNSYSMKHEPSWRGKPNDVLPLWVADMDFAVPPCVQEALARRVEHGIFGYSEPDAAFFDVMRKWFEGRFGWVIQRDWMSFTSGVVNALHIAIHALTKPGDGIVIQQPVYYPFEGAIKKTGRQLIVNQLVYKDGYYSIDFQDFEEKAKQAKMFILCNPHNPVGRVWKKDELERMGEICLRYGVKVIADEIHQDFVFPGHKHVVFSNLSRDLADITITCTAPSKTFNLAGLSHANIFISNKELREKFKDEQTDCGLGLANVMGLVACKAAYEDGAEWLAQLLDYISGNISLIDTYLAQRVPKIKLVKPEGTYLLWLDCNGLGLSDQKLEEALLQKAKLWFNSGIAFGKGGSGFARMNITSPRSVIQNALERLERV